jgi:putative ABC transport system ATP-binding protein
MGTGTRVVVPILIQQVIDRGFDNGRVNTGTVVMLCSGAAGLVLVTAMAMRTAIQRLGVRSEEALYGLRVRLFEHIHRLSLMHHNEEKKGALVARVTGDIETLSQFFSWGAAGVQDGRFAPDTARPWCTKHPPYSGDQGRP